MLMLQRYQEGLAAGASLASGRGVQGGAFRGSPAEAFGGFGLGGSPAMVAELCTADASSERAGLARDAIGG
eukprot:852399-Prymnesium_polylepis.1